MIGLNTLQKLANSLEQERGQQKVKLFSQNTLHEIYEKSGIDKEQFNRITSLLEKIAILIPSMQKI